MILAFVDQFGSITRGKVADLCHLTPGLGLLGVLSIIRLRSDELTQPAISEGSFLMKRMSAAAAALSVILTLGACGTSSTQDTATSSGSSSSVSSVASTETGFYDSSTVHSVSVTFDETEYDEMLQAYADTGEKEWITATVVIDGVTYENVGIKLKGNSSLQGLSQALNGQSGGSDSDLSPDEPEGLPWRIKLDEYVDGQDHDGETDFAVRGNSTETALNEAVSLELLDEAGLATQQASATRFSVNGSDEQLRLVVQNPDDQNWYEENVDDNGVLFKAESGGDYSYRGDDYTAYTEAFDLEANPDDLSDEEAYEPLIEFLDFINNADDETFAAELGNYLDVDSFAEYLAIEELLGNSDDIDGPGNNSYLAYDPDTGLFTVIAWDHNLTLGSGVSEDGEAGSRGNPLTERFAENEEFAALVDEASARLQSELIDSGYASQALEEWTTVLTDEASDLVSEETIASESESVAQALSGGGG